MQVEVRIEPGYTSPRVVVYTETMTDEVKELLDRIGTGVFLLFSSAITRSVNFSQPQPL